MVVSVALFFHRPEPSSFVPNMNSSSALERHPDLYFTDGDVVLAVKQTPKSGEELPKYTLFRVHKFLLRHHSVTFANFFADASAATTELYDGVPLAEMHGDKAEDFALLLTYLYNPASLVLMRHDPNTPLTVSGVIRLADKYLIEPLHRCLVRKVCEDWPTTLDEYDVQQAEIDALRKLCSPSYVGLTSDDQHRRLADAIPEPVSAILFAQEFGCQQILPAAFYRLSLIPVRNQWGKAPSRRALAARWSLLDKENLLRYIHGCQYLHEYRPITTFLMSEGCENTWEMEEDEDVMHPCYEFIKRLIEVVWDKRHSPTHPDPLRLLSKCADYDKMPQLSKEHFPQGLCRDCRTTIAQEIPKMRESIWERLSKAFKLE